MPGSNRISVRLEQEPFNRLNEHCQSAGCEVSVVVREALQMFLKPQQGPMSAATPKRLSPPENIFDLVPKYLNWGQGDLRDERKRLFFELLACSHVTQKHFPRTDGLREGYQRLLQLCEFFGVE